MYQQFALIGLAGYVAPRHLKAIKDTGNNLVAALDKSDSVGIVDTYFPNTSFFTEFERFERHLEKLKRQDPSSAIEFVSICSPNYLHDSHIRFALRVGADAICEKPLVLNPWNIDALLDFERDTGKRVFTVLQLRLHPTISALKNSMVRSDRKREIDLTYITSRGDWYLYSWKGEEAKSGGIATNIGIHFFDMLIWVFGAPQLNVVHVAEPKKAAGYLELEHARVRWFLSIDRQDLPPSSNATYRSINIDGEELEFSAGFTDLHTLTYQKILEGEGFGLEAARPSIETVYTIRNSTPVGINSDSHPLCRS